MNKYLLYCIIFIIVFTMIKAQFIKDPVKQPSVVKPDKVHLYVISDSLAINVGLEPHSGTIDSYLYYRDRVKVLERKDGWVRFTPFFDGADIGLKDSVAFWIDESSLMNIPPPVKDTLAPAF